MYDVQGHHYVIGGGYTIASGGYAETSCDDVKALPYDDGDDTGSRLIAVSTLEECRIVAEAIGINITEMVGPGSWSHVPSGCTVLQGTATPDSRAIGASGRVHFSTTPGDNNHGNGGYVLICKKVIDGNTLVKLPPESRIAILVRGQAFRQGPHLGAGCAHAGWHIHTQERIMHKLMKRIVNPLEQASHDVHIFVAESTNCSLLKYVTRVLDDNATGPLPRVRFAETFDGMATQKLGFQTVLDKFMSHAKPYSIESYRLVIVTRFDLIIWKSIFTWPTVNIDAFNFLSLCGDLYHSPPACVNDILYVMPGRYVSQWREMIGKEPGHCFTADAGDTGHSCGPQVYAAFGDENVRFITRTRGTDVGETEEVMIWRGVWGNEDTRIPHRRRRHHLR